MKNNIFLDGLRSVARVGETAVIAAKAGIRYATEKPSNAKLCGKRLNLWVQRTSNLDNFICDYAIVIP